MAWNELGLPQMRDFELDRHNGDILMQKIVLGTPLNLDDYNWYSHTKNDTELSIFLVFQVN